VKRFEHRLPGKVFLVKGKRLCGQRWTNLRNKWLRWNPTCASCGLAGEEVHHVVPRSVAPERTFDLSNLETLCRACHIAKHGKKPHY